MGILPQFYLDWVTNRRRSYIRREIEADRSLMDPRSGIGGILEERRETVSSLSDLRPIDHSQYPNNPDFDPGYNTNIYRQRLLVRLETIMDDMQQSGRLTLQVAREELMQILEGCERRTVLHTTSYQLLQQDKPSPVTRVTQVCRIPYIPEPEEATARKTANF
jgi:hypothetical protein